MPDDHLRDYVQRTRAGTRYETDGEEAVESALPEQGDNYQAHARPSTKPVYSLHCLLGAAGCRSFQYVHLDSDSSLTVERKGQVIALRFAGLKTLSVTIRGRNLRKVYDYIHQHRMHWIMQLEAGRDFGATDETVITAIEIAELTDVDERPAEYTNVKVLEMG